MKIRSLLHSRRSKLKRGKRRMTEKQNSEQLNNNKMNDCVRRRTTEETNQNFMYEVCFFLLLRFTSTVSYHLLVTRKHPAVDSQGQIEHPRPIHRTSMFFIELQRQYKLMNKLLTANRLIVEFHINFMNNRFVRYKRSQKSLIS